MSTAPPTQTRTQTYEGNDKLLIGLIFSILTFWLFAQSVGMVAPSILADLNNLAPGVKPTAENTHVLNAATMNLAVSLTALFSGMFIVLFGGLADRYGRVKLAIIGNIVSILACLLLIFAGGPLAAPLVLTARILQGLSGALTMPATLALVNTYWSGPARQRAVSMWSIGSFGGAALASFVAGQLVSWFGWRSVFVLSIVVAIIAILLIRGTPESKVPADKVRKIDPAGIVIFMVTILALMIITTFGAQLGWGSPAVLGLAALVIAGAVLFWVVEHRVAVPFIDFALFSNVRFTGAVAANFIANSSIGLIMVSQQLLQVGGGMSPGEAGLYTLGYAFCVIAFVRIGEKALQKMGPRKPLALALIILALGAAAFLPTHLLLGQYRWFALAGYTLFGIALALFATPATDTAMTNLPKEQSGAGAGIFKMASSLGGAIGAAISLTLFNTMRVDGGYGWLNAILPPAGRTDNIGIRQAADFSFSFHFVMMLIGLIVVLALIPKGRKEDLAPAVPAQADTPQAAPQGSGVTAGTPAVPASSVDTARGRIDPDGDPRT